MKKIVVYTTTHCPHCTRAKALLKRKGIDFEEIDVTLDQAKREEAEKQYGWMTVPVILIGDTCIGGADELYKLERNGELDKLLKV